MPCQKRPKAGGVFGKRRPKTEDRGSSLSPSLLVHVYVFPLIVPRAHTCTREVRGGERGREKTSDPPSSVFVFQNSLGCSGKRRPKTGDLNNKGRKEGRKEGRTHERKERMD